MNTKIHILIFTIVVLFSACTNTTAQTEKASTSSKDVVSEKSLKEQAIEQFKQEHYDEAIALLEKATKETPDDAEVWYYLGWYNHYRAYDSRPLKGYDYAYSQRIFDYLDRAIELNPNYGDALYFYGAECSGNAFVAMQNYDLKNLKYLYKKAYDKGVYPAWLIEFGKNILNTCDKNAILFTAGNLDFDVCMYLQLHQNYRTDITIIPIGNIDRPWYMKFMKDGLDGGFRKININLTNQQIMDMHPYKWDTTTVYIPVSQVLKTEFGLEPGFQIERVVVPDLIEPDRIVSKRAVGEVAKVRTFLSPRHAMLLQIVEDNFNDRPIHFSNFAPQAAYYGFDRYFQNCGLTSRLVPIEVKNTDQSYHISKMEDLFLDPENFKDFPSLKTLYMPRVSGILFNYHRLFNEFAQYYKRTKQTEKLSQLIETYKTSLMIGLDKEYEDEVLKEMQN